MSETKNTNIAMLSHLLGVFTSFIGPLIIFIVSKEHGDFVRRHSLEALNFQITLMLGYVVAGILSYLLIGFLLLPVLYCANLVLGVIATVKASNGQDYSYPFIIRLVK